MPANLSPLFHKFLEYLSETDNVLKYAVAGISRAVKEKELVEALIQYDKAVGKPVAVEAEQRAIAEAHAASEFAMAQLKSGFPALFGQAAVSIWAGLEALVEDIVVTTIDADKELLDLEHFRKIKVAFGEFQRLNNEDRLRYLLKEYARNAGAELKHGPNRFETLLKSINLSGQISGETSKWLFELWAVRNVIVHRAKTVDKQFCEKCPWVGLLPGDTLKVTSTQYSHYLHAASDYFREILIRSMVLGGKSREEIEKKMEPLAFRAFELPMVAAR